MPPLLRRLLRQPQQITSRQRLLGPAIGYYLGGLGSVLAGAAVTSASGSMLPLAMGSAVAVLTTAGWVRALRTRAAARRLGLLPTKRGASK